MSWLAGGLALEGKCADRHRRYGRSVLEGSHSQCGPISRRRRAQGRFRVILELSSEYITFARARGLVQVQADEI